MSTFSVEIEKALDVAVVERLDAEHVRTRIEPGNHERAVLAQREAADQLAGSLIEGDDVRAEHAAAALGDLPADAAGRACRSGRRVDVGDAGDVVRLERAVGDVAGREGDREHDRLGGEHAASAGPQLGFADRRVREPVQVTDLVQRQSTRDRRRSSAPAAATDHGKNELKKMSDSTMSPVVVSIKKEVAPSVRSMSGRF